MLENETDPWREEGLAVMMAGEDDLAMELSQTVHGNMLYPTMDDKHLF